MQTDTLQGESVVNCEKTVLNCEKTVVHILKGQDFRNRHV